jgi:hypothetical protein
MLIGIVSALVASALIAASKFTFWPLYLAVVGRGEQDISGTWDIFDGPDQSGSPVGEMKIKQIGRRINMAGTRFMGRNGKQINRKFHFRGRWQSEQLTAMYYDTSAHYRAGAVVLRWISSDQPHHLMGKVMYWDRTPGHNDKPDPDESGVVSYPYSLRRTNRLAIHS